jgi:hypothetical protein
VRKETKGDERIRKGRFIAKSKDHRILGSRVASPPNPQLWTLNPVSINLHNFTLNHKPPLTPAYPACSESYIVPKYGRKETILNLNASNRKPTPYTDES